MRKMGLITIGQSPRVDMVPEMEPIFGPDVELLQAGALDGLTKEEIATFKPEGDDYVLISKLRDGTSALMAEKYILPRLQGCIDKLEAEGVELILFLCTGEFPNFTHKVPLYFPCNILNGVVPAVTKNLAVVNPAKEQIQQGYERWKPFVDKVTSYSANPYGDPAELDIAAEAIAQTDADTVLLDCMGFTLEMKERMQKKSGKFVILSRTIAARVLSELLS